MTSGRAAVVSVIGAAQCGRELAALAEEVGRELAGKGAILVCGGGGGVMEAACRGAQGMGGITVGLLPGSDQASGNSFLTLALPTGLGEARNALVARAGVAVIAVGGGHGTLSEIAFALKAGLRVIGLSTWEAFNAEGERASILVASSASEAVEMALSDRTTQESRHGE